MSYANDDRLDKMVGVLIKGCEPKSSLQSSKYSNIFMDGNAIFSYGYHYPLVVKIGNKWLVNTTKYSPTTGRQTSKLYGALNKNNVDKDNVYSVPLEYDRYRNSAFDVIQGAINSLIVEKQENEKRLPTLRKGCNPRAVCLAEIAYVDEMLPKLVALQERERSSSQWQMYLARA